MNSKLNLSIFFTFVLAFCSISYELLIAQVLSITTSQTILWYSLTIGIYIACLGIGSYIAKYFWHPPLLQLFYIEWALSILGAISIAFMAYFLSLYNIHNVSCGQLTYKKIPLDILLFLQIFTMGIGVLSGFEIPIFLKMTETIKNNVHIILGYNYLGTLCGCLLFALFFAPFAPIKTALILATINLSICICIVVHKAFHRSLKHFLYILLALLTIFSISLYSHKIEQIYLKSKYYLPPFLTNDNIAQKHFKKEEKLGTISIENMQIDFFLRNGTIWLKQKQNVFEKISAAALNKIPKKVFQKMKWRDFFTTLEQLPTITRIHSAYQKIDIVPTTYNKENFALYLNGHPQFHSESEKIYHEYMAHIPIQLMQKIPKDILILGAGDGLLARELLKYKEKIKSITLVELDPSILHLAKNDKRFLKLNGHSLASKKIQIITNDAFYYIRHCSKKYDAVYIDFPYPNNYDLTKLYSFEFYKSLKKCLKKNSFVTLDAPLIQYKKRSIHNIIFSTIFYAGFTNFHAYGCEIEAFITMSTEKFKFQFKFHNHNINLSVLNKEKFLQIQTNPFPFKIDKKLINSIFSPILITHALED